MTEEKIKSYQKRLVKNWIFNRNLQKKIQNNDETKKYVNQCESLIFETKNVLMDAVSRKRQFKSEQELLNMLGFIDSKQKKIASNLN